MHCTSQKMNKISMTWKLIFLYKKTKMKEKKEHNSIAIFTLHPSEDYTMT